LLGEVTRGGCDEVTADPQPSPENIGINKGGLTAESRQLKQMAMMNTKCGGPVEGPSFFFIKSLQRMPKSWERVGEERGC
jgi:hypothetical protein